MTGTERREDILREIKKSASPVPAKCLAEKMGVSRQVIVQDIALIRAAGYDIVSTNRGYIVNASAETVSRLFKVRHTDEQVAEELYAIVDLGGRIDNVIVNHKVYGRLEAPLNISSRRQVDEFVNDLKSGKSSPLKNITSGYHYHLIYADSEKTLDMIKDRLKALDFLIET